MNGEDIALLCEGRTSGFVTCRQKTFPCVGTPTDSSKTREQLEDKVRRRYNRLSSKKKRTINQILSLASQERPIFWDCKDTIWFTSDKTCYGHGSGTYFTVEIKRVASATLWKDGTPCSLSLPECIENI